MIQKSNLWDVKSHYELEGHNLSQSFKCLSHNFDFFSLDRQKWASIISRSSYIIIVKGIFSLKEQSRFVSLYPGTGKKTMSASSLSCLCITLPVFPGTSLKNLNQELTDPFHHSTINRTIWRWYPNPNYNLIKKEKVQTRLHGDSALGFLFVALSRHITWTELLLCRQSLWMRLWHEGWESCRWTWPL